MIKHVAILPIVVYSMQLNLRAEQKDRPNILFVISDDQSFPYASAYGSKVVETPNFDRVARLGLLFTNAFVTSPGCSPSRASILTGRYPWQIEEAGTHGSSFPLKYKTFTQVLEENDYAVGFTGKPWGPGDWEISGWKQNPVGKEFNQKKLQPPYSGISKIDYAANFDLFLQQRQSGQPFFFWLGAHEPHRDFEKGSGIREGKSEADAKVPGFLPDHSVVKNDLLDYAVEIEWFDSQLGKALEKLDAIGELENTLVIVTADNGMPFPRAKANCYDGGIHVPLAICWGKRIPSGKVVGELTSTIDLAPTILEAAGARFDGAFPMSGKSILARLTSSKEKPGNRESQVIYAGRERHSSARYDNRGYPQRVIRTEDYLYVKNYHPEYWPSGDPQVYRKDGSLGDKYGGYMDIDGSPTLQLFQQKNVNDPVIAPFFLAATKKRPAEELFDIRKDPDCMINLAGKSEYKAVQKEMAERLVNLLKATHDPRESGSNPEIWETYPRLKGEIRTFPAESN